MAGRLIMVRHGQSTWNLENLFTGWTDVDLTPQGMRGSTAGGTGTGTRSAGARYRLHLGAETRDPHPMAHARGAGSAVVAGRAAAGGSTNVTTARCRGSTRRRPWSVTARRRCKIWRRSYDVPPPPLSPDDQRHPRFDPPLSPTSPAADLPATESLKDTLARVKPYWEQRIVPELRRDRTYCWSHTATASGPWSRCSTDYPSRRSSS